MKVCSECRNYQKLGAVEVARYIGEHGHCPHLKPECGKSPSGRHNFVECDEWGETCSWCGKTNN